jgi:hypothetical protein
VKKILDIQLFELLHFDGEKCFWYTTSVLKIQRLGNSSCFSAFGFENSAQGNAKQTK